MTQAQWQLLAAKITVLAAIPALMAWIVVYTNLARWWLDRIGRTFAFKTMILTALLILTVPGMFWVLTSAERSALLWAQVVLVGMITPVMVWRTVVFLQEDPVHVTLLAQWRRRRRRSKGGT